MSYLCINKTEDMSQTMCVYIVHEKFGDLLSQSYTDKIQFKLFLKMIQSSLALKEDLTTFNGSDFLVHIPYRHLVESVITTKVYEYKLSDHLKSKMEETV